MYLELERPKSCLKIRCEEVKMICCKRFVVQPEEGVYL